MPTVNPLAYCQDTLGDHFFQDMEVSKQRGLETYGTALQPFNTRDAGRDAYEEWVDLGMYIEQLRRERGSMIELLKDIAKTFYDRPLGKQARRMVEDLGEAA